VRGDPELEPATCAWALAAKDHLALVTEAVEALRKVFETDPQSPVTTSAVVASNVVSAASTLTSWLRESRAPKALGVAEAELGAAAGVFRNAAFAFRSLAEAGVEHRPARSTACATMLEQGDHHVEAFTRAIAKEIGGGQH
jgi:hypothetical protein